MNPDLDTHLINQEDTDAHLLKLADGRMLMLPKSLRKHQDGSTQNVIADLQHVVIEMQALSRQIDDLVREAREHGVSWEGIGWCVGTTGRAASMRWGSS